MEKPKCKLCGERHWGICPVARAEAREIMANHEDDIFMAALADSSSAAKQPKRKAKPRNPKLPAVASHQPSQLTEPEKLPVMDQLAPPGQCPHCDYRRAKAAEYVRLHRAKHKDG